MASGGSGAYHEAMAYSIVFMKGLDDLGASPWPGSFASAKRHAQDHFAIQQKQRGATRVEVRREDGRLMFGYPRTLHAKGS